MPDQIETNPTIVGDPTDDFFVGGYDVVVSVEDKSGNDANIALISSLSYSAQRSPMKFPELGSHASVMGVTTQNKSGQMAGVVVESRNLMHALYQKSLGTGATNIQRDLDDEAFKKGVDVKLTFHNPNGDDNTVAKLILQSLKVQSLSDPTSENAIGEVENLSFVWSNTKYVQ